jgi:hypothetical protein
MTQSNKRFRINTLIQLARITADEDLREEIVLEIQELLYEIENCSVKAEEQTDFSEDVKNCISEFLKDKDRVCPIMIWREALLRKGRPQKWQATEINDIMSQMPGWSKLPKVARFGKYGPQAGFEKVLDITESEETEC